MIDESITNLIQTVVGFTRVFPATETVVVTSDLPKIVYTAVPAGLRRYSDDGNSGLTPAHYSLDAFAAKLSDARALMVLIRKNAANGGLDGYKGTILGVKIDRIYFPQHEIFMGGDKTSGVNQRVARVTEMMIVEYREPV